MNSFLQASWFDGRATAWCALIRADGLALLRIVDDFSADNGHYAAGLRNLALRNPHYIRGEDREISELPRLDRSAEILFECRVCRPGGKHLERLFARDGLLRVPAFAGVALKVFTGYSRVEFDHGITLFHRRVRAACNDTACLQEALP